jgi:Fe-S-cluster-containing dehydrogenase component
VVACKRRSNMTPQTTSEYNALISSTSGSTVSEDELMVIKSQAFFDMGPMVRYSCWHCKAPSCLDACPVSDSNNPSAASNAIRKLNYTNKANGAVIVNYSSCQPDDVCDRQCVAGCRGGGYPQIQDPTSTGFSKFYPSEKNMNKCDMCWERVEDGKVPLCVQTCPADALIFDTLTNITNGYQSIVDQASQVIWVSRKAYFQVPKADPYVEDHMSRALDKLVRGPFSRLALVPAGLALGFYALQKRKEAVAEEVSTV